MVKKMSKKRRSPCPVSCSLDIFGDKWTLLVIRDLLLGRTRFKDIQASPESPPTNILTDRLNRLIKNNIIKKINSSDGTKHKSYELTAKGIALKTVVESIKDWGLRWEQGTEAKLLKN